jgi:hypothetical protein
LSFVFDIDRYLDGLDAFGDSSPGYGTAGFPNITQFIVHSQAPAGVNHGMIYRLNTFPAEHQLEVLDELAAAGFKVRSAAAAAAAAAADCCRRRQCCRQCCCQCYCCQCSATAIHDC